jgi:hypothetical protein
LSPSADAALLQCSTSSERRQLTELIAELHPDRHASVTNVIRELIGNT